MRRPMYPGLQTTEKVSAQIRASASHLVEMGETYHATIPVDGGAATVIRDMHGAISVSVRHGERLQTIALDDRDMLDVVRLVVEAAGAAS